VLDNSDAPNLSVENGTFRYKYTGNWETDGVSGWKYEYTVNETPLTSVQVSALNSGITAELVTKINELEAKLTSNSIIQQVYPVGSIYVSTSNISPSTLFGFGSWEQIKDRFLLAAGTTHSAGSIGGEETHTLTTQEMPRHNHMFTLADPQAGSLGAEYTCINRDAYEVYSKGWADTTIVMHAGKSAAHNNMPPYLTVYMWKRIS
jgi:hypothetical protein